MAEIGTGRAAAEVEMGAGDLEGVAVTAIGITEGREEEECEREVLDSALREKESFAAAETTRTTLLGLGLSNETLVELLLGSEASGEVARLLRGSKTSFRAGLALPETWVSEGGDRALIRAPSDS